MILKTLLVASSIVATGTKLILTIQDHKKMLERETLTKARNRKNYQRVLADMEHTRSVVDKVLDGDYGIDFVRAMRDIKTDREFERIVDRFDD